MSLQVEKESDDTVTMRIDSLEMPALCWNMAGYDATGSIYWANPAIRAGSINIVRDAP